MICANFDGRLGNQLFEYAFARRLRMERGEKDELVFNFNLVLGAGKSTEHFEDSLRFFNVLPYRVVSSDLIDDYANFKQKMIFAYVKLLSKFQHRDLSHQSHSVYSLMDSNGIVVSREDTDDLSFIVPSTRKVFTMGRFMIPSYIRSIKPILQKEFTPKADVLDVNKDFYRQILSSESVCVHVRRGDYLSEKFKKDFYVCDEQYFKKAIDLMMSKLTNPTFVFFSDDVDWVKRTFKVNAPCLYEREDDPAWEGIRLMYSCKHFIISNSTFSWWAQYLCANENKIVVSPDKWFANPSWKSYLIQDDFLRINSR